MYLSDLIPTNLNSVEQNNLIIGNEFDLKYYPHSLEGEISEIEYEIEEQCCNFYSDVVVRTYGDEVDLSVDFYVYADNILVAYLPGLKSGYANQTITANLYNVKLLKLITIKHGNIKCGCGAWLNPQVNSGFSDIYGALNDIIIIPPKTLKTTDTCIVTVTDVNFISRVDTMLYSLRENGNCDDATIVVFAFGELDNYKELVEKYDICLIQCNLTVAFSYKIKTAALSIARVFNANKYLYLDSDMLILDNVQPLFEVLDTMANDKILVCKESSVNSVNLGSALTDPYGVYYAAEEDLNFLELSDYERQYPLIVNNGVYCGTKKAILGLESLIRSMLPNSAYWEKFAINSKIFWREQAIFNIALAKGNIGVEIDELYNYQLNKKEVYVEYKSYNPVVTVDGKKVKVLHFNGLGREKYQDVQNYYNEKSSLVPLKPNKIIKYVEKFVAEIPSQAKTLFYVLDNYTLNNKVKNVIVLDDEIMTAMNFFDLYSCNTTLIHNNPQLNASGTVEEFLDGLELQQSFFDLIVLNGGMSEQQIYPCIIKSQSLLRLGGCMIMNDSAKIIQKMQKSKNFVLVPIIKDVAYYLLIKTG